MKEYLSMFQLKDHITVATGATGYLCTNFIEAVAQAGSHVAAIGRPSSKEKLEAFMQYIRDEYHVEAKCYFADFSNEQMLAEACMHIIYDFGHVDGLINAAGINQHGSVYDYTMQDLLNLMEINIASTFASCKFLGKQMCEQRKGSIVNIASYTGSVVSKLPRTMSGYDISKAGVLQLTKNFAAEFGQYQVRCNSVSPGYLEQGMSHVKNFKELKTMDSYEERLKDIPMLRVANAREMVGAVLYYLSDASTYTTGTDLVIDGGLHVW